MCNKKRLIVLDLSNFIFRAFYAIRPLNAPDGTPVNAVHGVLSMFLKLLSEYRPTHILIAKDSGKATFRKEMFEAYKANRSDPPEDLIPQFEIINELFDKLIVTSSKIERYEADDIIGSAVTQWKDKFDEVFIASGDKDLMQFVGENVKILDTMKNLTLGNSEVEAKLGVRPDQIVDYLSMVGDSSDNIPGMRGIGPKGAVQLLKEHDTLEKCIEVKDSFTGKKLTTAFSTYLDDAILSKKLVQIVTDLDLDVNPDDTRYVFEPNEQLYLFLNNLGFKSMLKKIKNISFNEQKANESDFSILKENLFVKNIINFESNRISTYEEFEKLKSDIKKHKIFSVFTLFSSSDVIKKEVVAIGFSFDGKAGYYLKFKSTDDLLDDPKMIFKEKDLRDLQYDTWENDNLVYSIDLKSEFSYQMGKAKSVKCNSMDITLAHYLIDSGKPHDLNRLGNEYLGIQFNHDNLSTDKIMKLDSQDMGIYIAERVCTIFNLGIKFKDELEKRKLDHVYSDIDAPLQMILGKMERAGIILNKGYLSGLEDEFNKTLNKLEHLVKDEIGEENKDINLKSPKQVADLLFDRLNLPTIKKTKTGYSTDTEVLEELDSKKLSNVPSLIIKYREIDKLLTTYIRNLPELVNPLTGRIHTSFNQYTAATGRLSSLNPNIQNIPVRTENGKKIRKGFIATPGKLLLSADYSQVELRILAHFSEDPTMVNAFLNNEDIHVQTASEILGISQSEVSLKERSKAKAVNFGLMYGQSSFGLAKTLKISRSEAKDYIVTYFEKFSSVKSYIDSLKEYCENHGFSITMHGRKRYLPDIHSQNRNIKSMAERVAVNSPIQGTAADIIKLAMIKVDQKLKENNLKSKMLLQVHDELIFEVEEDEIMSLKAVVIDAMENIVKLKVPLKVDVGIGVNWFDLK